MLLKLKILIKFDNFYTFFNLTKPSNRRKLIFVLYAIVKSIFSAAIINKYY